jgi:hypothetical protein
MKLADFRPTRLQGWVWAMTVVAPLALVASLAVAGNLHPHVRGFWALAGLAVFSVIILVIPGGVGVWASNKQWNAMPDCRRCGRKMIPASVRLSAFSRIRYYRCNCVKREQAS